MNDASQPVTGIVHGVPKGKPRMTRSDSWKKRPCVVEYWSWADKVREAFGISEKFEECPIRVDWQAYFPIPKSKAKKGLAGKPHTVKPDRDNVDKGILDALFQNDSGVASGTLEKFWDDGGGPRLEIKIYWR